MTARERAEASRATQGFPPRLEDPSALAQLAALLHREEAADGS